MALAAKKAATASHTFSWQGKDAKGRPMKGELIASNVGMARAELRRQGLQPSKIRKKAPALFKGKGKPITPGDIAVFARQLATMMSSGVPLVQSFDIVGRGHEKASMQELLLKIKADIEGGTALADALGKHPLYFDDLFCNLVKAGEAAGVLEPLLDKIATYKEKTESLKGKIKKALFYPAAVIAVAVIVTAVILIFVIPQFQSLFRGFGAELPAFTQMVLHLSDWMQNYWWAMILGLGGIGYGIKGLWKRSRPFRQFIDRAMLRIPTIGPILHKAAIARFSRTTATMFAAGVPLVEALESVAGATGNIVYEEAVLKMREDVATGQSLQLTMKQQRIFPHMTVQMVAIGEESGSLDHMLSKVADFYEEQVDNAVDSLSSLLEPMIMVIIGVLVGGLVVAMYLPIFQMASAV
ncbi:MAG: type II secretion system protein F [Candidatus Sedimenticola endophacoides]|uniref:Type II secretion system protein F n=1 Tax=Candidatus Sedimenticola endophacoides TaxID=2548426 RepID=A0A657Q7B9_9GAMM|nr:MAG: type II secretion system protein F [Candidatus Sedimenticola endophacoides]OQX33892.1 MAG: type II secretion system protein F [Candidatus Sedimenticola endophacoides]OQX40749.1 MAG: type II secretion system protein F [Candidatus Sedimenticola endophacoides]OQX44316.1 MAG: type II secretion system protein F [Candidatus Sedimenticola endophacoides]OQX45491.1 MAG: type II secretion system protein F [Candidatus Sedimenticola endophacoides]